MTSLSQAVAVVAAEALNWIGNKCDVIPSPPHTRLLLNLTPATQYAQWKLNSCERQPPSVLYWITVWTVVGHRDCDDGDVYCSISAQFTEVNLLSCSLRSFPDWRNKILNLWRLFPHDWFQEGDRMFWRSKITLYGAVLGEQRKAVVAK